MTRRYRHNRETILASSYQNLNLLSYSETFNRAAVDALLAQPGCTAIRIYYGMDHNLKVHAILVGADANKQDILPPPPPPGGQAPPEAEGYLAEQAIRCPPICPPPGILNG